MRRKFLRALRCSLWGLTVLLTACMDPGAMRPDQDSGSANVAEIAYRNGNFERAGQVFMELAQSDDRLHDHYRLRAAEAFREGGNLNAVAWALQDVKSRDLSSAESARVDLLEAEVALSHHDAVRAATFLTFPDSALPPLLRVRAFELRARAAAARGDAWGSARTRAALDALLAPGERMQNETQIKATLASIDSALLQQQMRTLAPNDPLRPFVESVLGTDGSMRARNDAQAQTQGVLDGTRSLADRAGYRAARVIALLLPVDGQLKGVAQAIRDGFFAAYFADAHMPRPELRVYDSGNSVSDAIAAYQHAVSDGADRIVGPLRRDAVSGVLAQPGLKVPVLALNQPQHNESPPAGSAAFALSPDTEAAQAAQHMLERGITRAAIITATEDWAERAASAFRTQFESGHGVIIGEARVRDSDINFLNQVRQALGSVPTTVATTPLPGAAPAPLPSNASVDTGVFISMRPQQARLLLPQIKLAGYSSLPIFATSHVFAGNVNPGMDRDLDGLEFCDAPWLFDAVVGLPRYSDIATTLDSARGAGARLFAMGMDAYALVPYLDWMALHQDSYVPGATGQLVSDAQGRIQRQLIWARFNEGVAQPLNGNLQMSNSAQ